MAIDKSFEAESNRFGPARNDSGGNELVDGSGKIVLDPRNQLRHTFSIVQCNAKRVAPTRSFAGYASDGFVRRYLTRSDARARVDAIHVW